MTSRPECSNTPAQSLLPTGTVERPSRSMPLGWKAVDIEYPSTDHWLAVAELRHAPLLLLGPMCSRQAKQMGPGWGCSRMGPWSSQKPVTHMAAQAALVERKKSPAENRMTASTSARKDLRILSSPCRGCSSPSSSSCRTSTNWGCFGNGVPRRSHLCAYSPSLGPGRRLPPRQTSPARPQARNSRGS